MMKIRQNYFTNFFKRKFFNKILLTYMMIVLFALSALVLIVSENVSNMILNREITYNKLILRNLNNFFDQKCSLVKKMLLKTYMDSYIMPEVIDFIETDNDKSSNNYVHLINNFKGYFLSAFSQDDDISGITIYKKADGSIFYFSKNSITTYNKSEFVYPERLKQITDASYHLNIIPAFYPMYNYNIDQNNMVYTISINIRRLGTNENTGILMIDFDQNGISRYLSQFENNIKAQFLILTKNRDVIYDSTGEYNKNKSQYNSALKNSDRSPKINGEEYVVNIDKNNDSGVITASFVQKKDILRSIYGTRQSIFLVSFICMLIALLLTYISTSLFSRRIKTITSAMKELQTGNLSVRIPLNETGDEISNIAVRFNKMSNELNEYINKVYISDLKQKSAELAALQAQINPHFLYNTLEAIRMNAVTFGDNSTSEMIYVLSKLFRNSIKDDSIIIVKDELKHSKLYLELFKMRYGDSLSVKFDVDETILDYGIIKHLIQPVIENFIIHGFDSAKSTNIIHVRGYLDNKNIIFIITDNGKGIEAEKLEQMKISLGSFEMNSNGSIGLANINERIKLVYGKEYGIEISSEAGSGTTVVIKILAVTKEELKNRVQGNERQ